MIKSVVKQALPAQTIKGYLKMPASNFQVAFIIQPANSKLIQTMHFYEKLSSLLGLAYHPNMQDWELENANPERLPEFIHAYQTGSKTAAATPSKPSSASCCKWSSAGWPASS